MDFSHPLDPSDLFSAKGLVIVLTGGGTGIGLAFANALARSGAAKLYLLGRRLEKLQEAATSISASISSSSSSESSSSTTTEIIPLQCDITSPSSISTAVSHVESTSGYVDVIINNAGVTGPHQDDYHTAKTIPVLQEILLRDWSLWDDAWRTNTSSIVAVTGAFLHLLDEGNRRRGWGSGKREQNERVGGGIEGGGGGGAGTGGPREGGGDGGEERKEEEKGFDLSDRRMSQVITVASIGAFNRECTAGLAYTGSKAGAVAIAKSLAYIFAGWGIRSNVICPGRFPSEMTLGGKLSFPVREVPFGSMGVYDDLAAAILYLVGRSGAYLNGNVLTPDGGRLSVMPATN